LWEQQGDTKSASVRVVVPKIDFSGAAEPQQAEIRAGLEACERLRASVVDPGAVGTGIVWRAESSPLFPCIVRIAAMHGAP